MLAGQTDYRSFLERLPTSISSMPESGLRYLRTCLLPDDNSFQGAVSAPQPSQDSYQLRLSLLLVFHVFMSYVFPLTLAKCQQSDTLRYDERPRTPLLFQSHHLVKAWSKPLSPPSGSATVEDICTQAHISNANAPPKTIVRKTTFWRKRPLLHVSLSRFVVDRGGHACREHLQPCGTKSQ